MHFALFASQGYYGQQLYTLSGVDHMKWTREQYLSLMSPTPHNRPMFCELFGPLVGLESQWKAQGATPEELDLTAFCFDYVPVCYTGAMTGICGGYEPQIIEDNDDYCISRDAMGRTMKLIKSVATLPLPLDYPVKDMESWKKIKPLFAYDKEISRIDKKQLKEAAKQQMQGVLILEAIPGGYNMPRQLMGEEALAYAVYDQPQLIRDMMETFTETACKVLEEVCESVVPDCLCVGEDLAGKSGPLYGPNQVREFIQPYYKAVWQQLSKQGTRLFSQDSDGNINPILDLFVECGVNVFYPLEPAASMDVVQLRQKYGRQIFFKGGIDKHAIRGGRDSIHKELEYKLTPLLKEGGCVFSLDHRIPNGTSLADYTYYVDTARDMLGLPPRYEDEVGWARMAF